jgi:hypothetical protein
MDLADQLVGNFRHVRENIMRLGHEVKGAECQRLECDRSPRRAVRTDHDHRHPPVPHDLFQRINPVQAGHFQIECHHLWRQIHNFFQCEMAVHRRAHHLDRVILFEDLGNQLAHQRRVVHHQHPHRLSHA